MSWILPANKVKSGYGDAGPYQVGIREIPEGFLQGHPISFFYTQACRLPIQRLGVMSQQCFVKNDRGYTHESSCLPSKGAQHALVLCNCAQNALCGKDETEGEANGRCKHSEGHQAFVDQPAAQPIQREQGRMNCCSVQGL